MLGHEIPTDNKEDSELPGKPMEGWKVVQKRKQEKERIHERYVAPVDPHKYDDKTTSVATQNVTSENVTGNIDEGTEVRKKAHFYFKIWFM
jgi:hypothetical protein